MFKKLCLTLIMFSTAGTAMAEQDLQTPQGGPAEAGQVVQSVQIASRIPALLEQSRLQIAALEAQYRSNSAEDLQLQIQTVKMETELQRLQILAEECRDHGRTEEAALAEAQLLRLQQPDQHQQNQRGSLTLEEKRAMKTETGGVADSNRKAVGVSSTTAGGQK